MLGRPAGPGGEGGGGVGTPRVVSADPGLLGTFWQTRGAPFPRCPRVAPGTRAHLSMALQPLLYLPLEWSLARAWPQERQRLCRLPGTCWPRPESRTQRLPPALVQLRPTCGLRSKAAGCPLTLPGPPSNSEALK